MKVARLTSDFKLLIRGNVYHELDALDMNSTIDTTYEIDLDTTLSGNVDISSLIKVLFGIQLQKINADRFRLDSFGNLVTPQIFFEVDGVNASEGIDLNRTIDTSINLDTEDEISAFLNIFFGVNIHSVKPNRFSVLNDGSIVVNEVLENQKL